MLYFLPNWDDRLDPDYDFETDKFSRDKLNSYEKDIYIHQIFEKPPYDGILISLAVFKNKINDTKNRQTKQQFNSIKEYLCISKNSNLKVLGDCGAFNYIYEDFPPEEYKIDRVANIYQMFDFDYGVSVDHMIPDIIIKNGKKINLTDKQKEERRVLTLTNAKEFIEYHKKKNFNFEPIGAVQGYCTESYTESAVKTVEMGYSYIGIGTLVPKSDEEIITILNSIIKAIGNKNIKIHLFGVLRLQKIKEFKLLGVTSFDSTSFFRKAWLENSKNYLTKDGNWYTAIRIPYSENSVLVKNALEKGYSISDIKQLENNALKSVRQFASNKIQKVEDVIEAILKYDSLLLRKYDKNLRYDKYIKTLLDRPWEKCKCEICKEIGVEVIIFRGTNRNKRRGFHNVKVFYDYMLNNNSKN